MTWRQAILLSGIIALLAACKPERPERTSSTPTRSAPSPPAAPKLELKWGGKLPMEWRAEQALIVRDTVYFGNFGRTPDGSPTTPIIAAFNLSTRQLMWQIEQKPLTLVANDSERLFALTDKGIGAISLADGSTLWQTGVPSEDSHYQDELLPQDGWLFYGDGHAHTSELYGLDAQTGTILWTTVLTAPMDQFKPSGVNPALWNEYRAMAYDRGRLYVRVIAGLPQEERYRVALTALDAGNGHRLWDFPFEVPTINGESLPGAASRLAFSEQAVYLSAFGGVGYALERDTGKTLWEHEVDIERPVYVDDQIIAIANQETVAAVDAQTGNLKWTVPFQYKSIGTLSPFVFSDGYLIFYAAYYDTGQLFMVDIKSGEKVFTLWPALPDDCIKSPAALALHEEHLYLVTLTCMFDFQVSKM